MVEISARQGKILAAIVKEYSQTGEPVGSSVLLEKYNFEVSSATVRNEMQALEKLNLITHPHTSAGRIPTDAGYRYFVNKLMKHLELSQAEQQKLQTELKVLQKQYIELGQSLTKLLASQTQGAAFALLPGATSTMGLSKVIEQGMNNAEIKEVARFLENIAEYGRGLAGKDLEEVKTYIGREAPVPIAKDFSLVVTRVDLPRGGKGIVGIIGPKRMKYARNMSLLEYVKKLLTSGLVLLIILHV